MENSGKFQANENKLITLGKTPQFPWRLPEISLWKVHNLPMVMTMVKPVNPVNPVNSVKKPVKTMEKPVNNRQEPAPVKPVNTMKNLSSLYPVKNGLLSNTLRMQEVLRQSPGAITTNQVWKSNKGLW